MLSNLIWPAPLLFETALAVSGVFGVLSLYHHWRVRMNTSRLNHKSTQLSHYESYLLKLDASAHRDLGRFARFMAVYILVFGLVFVLPWIIVQLLIIDSR